MKCKVHPKYAASRKPARTARHPDGCPTCWQIWEDMSNSQAMSTVVIELGLEEARALALCIDAALRGGGTMSRDEATSVIRPFCGQLLQQVKEAGA